jgi:glutathione S-transferase
MTKTPTKAESLAARAETLAIAEALERRFGCSALVLTADIERAAAELRCLSAENTAAVSAFLAADDERRELRTERDALRAALTRVLDTHEREAKAYLTAQVASENFSRRSAKADEHAHLQAAVEASKAEKEARELLAAMKGTT